MKFLKITKHMLIALVVVVTSSNHARGAGFEGLGDLPGGENVSYANAISADGSTIVGSSSSQRSYDNPSLPGDISNTPFHSFEAFRWTRDQGIETLDLPPAERDGKQYYSSYAGSASYNGSVVAGSGLTTNSMKGSLLGVEGLRWKGTNPVQKIGVPETAGQYTSPVFSISADGETLGGWMSEPTGGYVGFLWNESWGSSEHSSFKSVGHFSNFFWGMITGVSASGEFAVGYDMIFDSIKREYHVTPGIVDLENSERITPLFSDNRKGQLSGVSANGKVLFGSVEMYLGGPKVGFWFDREKNEMRYIYPMTFLTPQAGLVVSPKAANIDGSILVGEIQWRNSDSITFIWSKERGFQLLESHLRAIYATQMRGWKLRKASGISGDGRVVVGAGINPRGEIEAYRAELQ